MPKVIAINIIDYDFLATDNVHTVFNLRDKSEPELMLTDVLEIHFINMVKWRKLKGKDIEGDPLHQWLVYFDRTSPPELVEEVKKMNDGIQMADERMVYVTGDEEAIRAYEMRQMAIYDMNTRFREGIEEGREQGLAEGHAKGLAEGHAEGIVQGKAEGVIEANLEIARKMKSMGIPADQIHAITSLPTETIETL